MIWADKTTFPIKTRRAKIDLMLANLFFVKDNVRGTMSGHMLLKSNGFWNPPISMLSIQSNLTNEVT